jgi:hypothetical protein
MQATTFNDRRHVMKKLILVFALGLAIAAGAITLVQAQAQPIVMPAPQPAPTVMPQIMAQPIGGSTTAHNAAASVTITTLSADTFAVIKDHGDSQTVLVYKTDDQGNVRLTSKKKFIY